MLGHSVAEGKLVKNPIHCRLIYLYIIYIYILIYFKLLDSRFFFLSGFPLLIAFPSPHGVSVILLAVFSSGCVIVNVSDFFIVHF